jgi:hypothetical protein
MARTIGLGASPEKIEEHVRETLLRASAQGGKVAELAQGRLGPSLAPIESALAVLKTARAAEDEALAHVQVEKKKSDVIIATVRDEMWNTLGRPRPSPEMDAVFPEGVAPYTTSAPIDEPLMMSVLEKRIQAAVTPRWTPAMLGEWASSIETARATFEPAVDVHRRAKAAATIARVAYRTAVRAAHARLADLKRDLKSLRLTEAQIADVIPDAGRPAQTSAPPPAPGDIKPITPKAAA